MINKNQSNYSAWVTFPTYAIWPLRHTAHKHSEENYDQIDSKYLNYS